MTDIPIPNSIERRLVLHTPPEQVWEAITEKKQFDKWFSADLRFDSLTPGDSIVFSWEGGQQARGIFETIDPARKLAFRWEVPGDVETLTPLEEMPTTLVTFVLEEISIGTRLIMLETGFASLPPDVRRRSYHVNMRGWDVELKALDAYLKAKNAAV